MKLIAGGSLIQSTVPGADGSQGNLEAVVGRLRADGYLDIQHYWRDQSRPDTPWNGAHVLTTTATGPAALTQRHDPQGSHGNFEVVVPERGGGLAHYWADNADPAHPWHRFDGWAASGADGPGAVVENRITGHLEAVALHGTQLVHHRFDGATWTEGRTIFTRAVGAPTLVQSSYDGHLEVVIGEEPNLVLYFLDGIGEDAVWRSGGIVTLAGGGSHGMVQGRYGVDPHRNFEVLVPRGDQAVGYWRDNARPNTPWRPAGVATWGAGTVESVALCSTTLGGGWLQALTQENTSIYHLYRHPVGSGFRWMRGACLRLDDRSPIDAAGQPRSRKLAQVTGTVDLEAMAHGSSVDTLSTSFADPGQHGTLDSSGINGTDLGVSFRHGGRHFVLFGDTYWTNGCWTNLDAIGEVRTVQGEPLPRVEVHGAPLLIVGGTDVTERDYDVPLDAFSVAGQAFVFLSSNRFQDWRVMGCSVLTRCRDPRLRISGTARTEQDRPELQYLTTLSSHRFINMSVQHVRGPVIPGAPDDSEGLLIWGTGAYRADDVRLAYLDLSDPAVRSYLLDDEPFDVAFLGLRFFTGLCGNAPLWSAHEDEARPLFFPSALGEISVRWVPQLHRYVLLAMSGTEHPSEFTVYLRTAPAPWGPWSSRRLVFDGWLDGLGYRPGGRHFIHRGTAEDDHVGDRIFPQQWTTAGAAYAPYLFDVVQHRATITLRYTLSTWNPYQVMLMAHDLPADLP